MLEQTYARANEAENCKRERQYDADHHRHELELVALGQHPTYPGPMGRGAPPGSKGGPPGKGGKGGPPARGGPPRGGRANKWRDPISGKWV